MRVIRWKTRLTIRSAIARRMPASCLAALPTSVLQRELGSQRYADPDVPSRDHPADILPTELDRLREMMLGLINQPEHFKQWFGEFITQSRHELDVAPPEPPYQPDEIYDALQQGDTLERLGGLRVLRIDGEVFVNGEKINSPHRPALDALATHLSAARRPFWRCAGRSFFPSPCWQRWSTAAIGSLATEPSSCPAAPRLPGLRVPRSPAGP